MTEKIISALEEKSGTKQFIYKKTIDIFKMFRTEINAVAKEIAPVIHKKNNLIEISVKDNGNFETALKFSGDTLLFIQHTNIFTFPPDNFIYKTKYIQEDPMRGYFGMIMIYNFLSDSIKYQRMNDRGYLIARIFVNKDGHFIVQGKRQFSFMYNDITEFEINAAAIRLIIEQAMQNTIEFDLFVPPFDMVKEITLGQKFQEEGNIAIQTGKRLGFDYSED